MLAGKYVRYSLTREMQKEYLSTKDPQSIADVAQLKRHQRQPKISKCPGCLRVNFSDSKPRKTNLMLGIFSTRNAER